MTVQKDWDHLPDFEKLAAWRDGALTDDESEDIAAHVETCEECRDYLLLLSDETEERAPRPAEPQETALWRAVRAEIRVIEAQGEARAARHRLGVVRAWRRRERFSLVAAGFLLVVLLGSWGARQAETLDRLTRPQMNVAIHDVLEIAHRGTGAPAEPPLESHLFEIPEGTQFFTLTLPLSGGYDRHRVQIHDEEGSFLWSDEGLEVDRFGLGTLGLSRHFLPAGRYRLDVEGRRANDEFEPLGSWWLDLRYR